VYQKQLLSIHLRYDFNMKPVKFSTQRATAGAPQGGAGYNSLAAGKKAYGSGRPMPTMGKVQNKSGYAMRDGKMAARREALMRRSGGM
jgi:hypothetical protein